MMIIRNNRLVANIITTEQLLFCHRKVKTFINSDLLEQFFCTARHKIYYTERHRSRLNRERRFTEIFFYLFFFSEALCATSVNLCVTLFLLFYIKSN
jgi:hypothetical protein